MQAKGKTPKVRIAAARREPVRNIPEGRQSKDCVSRPVRAFFKGEDVAVFVLDKKKKPLIVKEKGVPDSSPCLNTGVSSGKNTMKLMP